jgi:hypothetical protein
MANDIYRMTGMWLSGGFHAGEFSTYDSRATNVKPKNMVIGKLNYSEVDFARVKVMWVLPSGEIQEIADASVKYHVDQRTDGNTPRGDGGKIKILGPIPRGVVKAYSCFLQLTAVQVYIVYLLPSLDVGGNVLAHMRAQFEAHKATYATAGAAAAGVQDDHQVIDLPHTRQARLAVGPLHPTHRPRTTGQCRPQAGEQQEPVAAGGLQPVYVSSARAAICTSPACI